MREREDEGWGDERDMTREREEAKVARASMMRWMRESEIGEGKRACQSGQGWG
jgi:hypothetical protein